MNKDDYIVDCRMVVVEGEMSYTVRKGRGIVPEGNVRQRISPEGEYVQRGIQSDREGHEFGLVPVFKFFLGVITRGIGGLLYAYRH